MPDTGGLKRVGDRVQVGAAEAAADKALRQAQAVQSSDPQEAISLFKSAASGYMRAASQIQSSPIKGVSKKAVVGGAIAGGLVAGFVANHSGRYTKHDRAADDANIKAHGGSRVVTGTDANGGEHSVIETPRTKNQIKYEHQEWKHKKKALKTVGTAAGAVIGGGLSLAKHKATVKNAVNRLAGKIQVCVAALRNLGAENEATNIARAASNILGSSKIAIEVLQECFEEYAKLNGCNDFTATMYGMNMVAAYEAMLEGKNEDPAYAKVYIFAD
jgi:hypothetical protein